MIEPASVVLGFKILVFVLLGYALLWAWACTEHVDIKKYQVQVKDDQDDQENQDQ